MKAIKCEMCGSCDLIKQDGVFICQNCGMKYSLEDAKKLMIEGTVDVSGSTVKVDNSTIIENNLISARQSLLIKDWRNAKLLYSNIRQEAPNNMEALIYVNYCLAMESLSINQLYERQAIFEALCNSIMLFCSKFTVKPENEALYQKLNEDLLQLASSSFVYTTNTINGFFETSNDSVETTKLFCDVLTVQAISSVSAIAPKYEKTNTEMFCLIHRSAIILFEAVISLGGIGRDKTKIRERILDSHKKIASVDESYIIPETATQQEKTNGCYVATCVYGSYDCPQVWTLRRYRDYKLASTWYGRAFIHIYYAISPTLVKWFGKTKWFKKMWKGKLDRMVKKLENQGFKNTPYVDKNW